MQDLEFRAYEFGNMYYQVRVGGMFDGIATSPTTWTGSDWVNLTGGEHTKVMQYINQRDKNDNKIFEDDLVMYKGKLYQIVFYYGAFALKEVFAKCSTYLKNEYTYYNNVEIVGNIHQNKNLLEHY